MLIGWQVYPKSERESVPIVRRAPRGGALLSAADRVKLTKGKGIQIQRSKNESQIVNISSYEKNPHPQKIPGIKNA